MSQDAPLLGCFDWDGTITNANMDNDFNYRSLLAISDGSCPILYQYDTVPEAQIPSGKYDQQYAYSLSDIKSAAMDFMAQDGNMPNVDVMIQYNILITAAIQKGMKLAICTCGERPDAIYEILKSAPISIDEDVLRYHMVVVCAGKNAPEGQNTKNTHIKLAQEYFGLPQDSRVMFVDDSPQFFYSAQKAQYKVYEADQRKEWVLRVQSKIDSLAAVSVIKETIRSPAEIFAMNEKVAQEVSEVSTVAQDQGGTFVKLATVPTKKKRPSK